MEAILGHVPLRNLTGCCYSNHLTARKWAPESLFFAMVSKRGSFAHYVHLYKIYQKAMKNCKSRKQYFSGKEEERTRLRMLSTCTVFV